MTTVGVICGDRWHPSETVITGLQGVIENSKGRIQGQQSGETQSPQEDVKLEVLQQGDDLTKGWLANKNVVVLAKLNHMSEKDTTPWLTTDIKLALMEYVANGGGLLVIHAGTVGFKDDPAFCKFIGGVFAYHPDACRVTLTFNPSAAPFHIQHTENVVIFDEHYMMDMAEDDLEVFMTADSEHGMQAAGWVKYYGKGKVCTLTPGHFLDVWREREYQDIIANSLNWCANSKK